MITVIKNNDEIRMALDDDSDAPDNIPEYHQPFFRLIYVFNSSYIYQSQVRNNGRLAFRLFGADHDLKSVQSIANLPSR